MVFLLFVYLYSKERIDDRSIHYRQSNNPAIDSGEVLRGNQKDGVLILIRLKESNSKNNNNPNEEIPHEVGDILHTPNKQKTNKKRIEQKPHNLFFISVQQIE